MDFSLSMALVDYIPVALFAAAAMILLGDFYGKMCKGAYTLFAAGSVMVMLAGALKATWKLLYAINVCDFVAFNDMFFPVQSFGFLFAALGLLIYAFSKKSTACAAAAPVAFESAMPFVGVMVLGTLGICIALSTLAAKLKKKGSIALFVLSFIFMMMMGYLSSRDFTQASMNWIAQFVNIFGQGFLLWGVLNLHKAQKAA